VEFWRGLVGIEFDLEQVSFGKVGQGILKWVSYGTGRGGYSG